MFRKKHNKSIEITKLSSLVADNMAIKGDVLFSGGLRVDGRIDGNVVSENNSNGLLVLSDKGTIHGSVRTYDAVINGTISGDLEVEHFLELQANARVTGNITYRQLQLECGATVDGKLLCAPEATVAVPATVAAPSTSSGSSRIAGLLPDTRPAPPSPAGRSQAVL